MVRPVARMARIVAGGVLVMIGIAGCLLPILPGIPFLILGLGMLSVDIPAVRRVRDRALAWARRPRAGRRGH